MKVFRIPFFIMLSLLLLALVNSICLSRCCNDWLSALESADTAARQDDWESARQQLAVLYDDWEGVQTWLHITIEHEALNTTQSLFRRTLVLGEEEDSVEFRAHLADLHSQMQLLAELERISIKNVL
ncbi:MAG: DUF4363 family protein [Ruminococcaceae bacterium]|nr:DUF4363 family protein [Oscillospiraceae bacterium]